MLEAKKTLTTHYVKNNDFKTVFSTAIFGGITINGLISLNFCVDRTAIPTKTESVVDGLKVTEIKRESKEGIVKEVQFGTLMDINTAKSTVTWLQEKIKTLEDLQKNILPK